MQSAPQTRSGLLGLLGRREFLRVGALSLGGLALPALAACRRVQAARASAATAARGKRCIVLWNMGGPAHQDTFDLKPNAPAEIRGEFRPIATNVPGIQISEHLPRLAQHADKFAILRALHTDTNDHSPSLYAMLSGFFDANVRENTGFQVQPNDHAGLGSVLWKLRGKTGPVPPYVLLCGMPDYNGGPARGEIGSRLGRQYDPLTISRQDYAAPGFRVPDLQLNQTMTSQRFDGRQGLLRALNDPLDRQVRGSGWAAHQQDAFDLLRSPRVQAAFDLTAEPERVRDRYGRHAFGQAALLARRLIEHEVGVSTVVVHWTSTTRPSRGDAHWDTHVANFTALKELLLPTTDQAFAALLEDLHIRGLLDETLVVWMGDFGRTPRINANAGRDHWGRCFSVVLAGGGIRGGQVYGSSDRNAALPRDNPLTHGDLHATIYHALGIDSQATTITDALGRELFLHDRGTAVRRLFE